MLNNLLNKTATRYRRVVGSSNEYGEKSITFVQSSTFKIAFQPQTQYEKLKAPGEVLTSSNNIQYVGYCKASVTINVLDRIKVDDICYEIFGIMNESGRNHHLKLLCRKVDQC